MMPAAKRTTPMRQFVTSKGEVINSPLRDTEAVEVLRRTHSNFAASLVRQCDRGRPLSNRQWPWVHKLALEQIKREKDAKSPKAPAPVFKHIRELFSHALASGLKTPKITLALTAGPLKLAVAGAHSRTPGAIHVTDGGSYYNNRYYGRLDTDGTWNVSRRGCPDWVVAAMTALDDDPVGYATEYGKRTGNCCFCNRELSTPESLAAGYGPVCADKYGLPWG